MDTKNLQGLLEAYDQVYSPENLSEEVEVAAQYFYEMGLNEDGISILIEELGVEEFGNFVYDIAEEHILTEARAGGVKIKPETAKGKEIKGKPSASSLKRLRRLKDERKSSEEKASSEKPSGLKSSLQRQSAVASAKKKQPKKPGLLDRVAREVNKGMERHKAAMSAARETGKTIGKAAKGAGHVAREFGKGVGTVAKVGKKVLTGEEVDVYDLVLAHLLDEGYADTEEAATAIMANMSDEWRQSILEETKRTEYLQKKFDKENAQKSGSALKHIPGKQSTGQALYKARQSERHMKGEK